MNTEREEPSVRNEERDLSVKTSDLYAVDQNLPKRFNNPDCFGGYSKKVVHPLYKTTNQTYGGRKPTVHEMPTRFHGDKRRFSEHLLNCGMYRDARLNTAQDTGRVMLPSSRIESQDRIRFHLFHLQRRGDQTAPSGGQQKQ